MEKALLHFKKYDPVLYTAAKTVKFNSVISTSKETEATPNYFVDLVESIISQQLSGKAADTIFGRFKKLFPKEKITPEKLVKIPDEKIRQAGISYSKINYIKGIAQVVINKQIDLNSLEKLNDEEVIRELVKLKGVGQWTAEMYLMFTLQRPDIFSPGDLGLQNAMIKIYKLDKKPKKEILIEISDKWSPYRTTACRILWKSLE
jgi:DNA-3-methyladenine glycosylase II